MFPFFSKPVPEITVKALKQALDTKQKFILLDVRTQEEYSQERIKGSINIPLGELDAHLAQDLPDKNKVIYVHCRSGARSTQAVTHLMAKGYRNVFNIQGGIMAWNRLDS